MNNYFIERCTGSCKLTDFWKTIKPYLSKKASSSQNKVVLKENDQIISKENDVAETFNDFYINVAKDIGQNYTFDKNNHPSLYKITENCHAQTEFNFKSVDQKTVSKMISRFNVKATGGDKISVKILKLGQQAIVPHFEILINNTILTGCFPII